MTITGQATERENQPGTPRLLRSMNERVLLEHLRRHGPISRAQLARATGLSKPTVSQALANLERAGLVRPVGQAGSERGGRQAILYEPDPTAGYVLGIDIGRSWVRVAVADLASAIIARCDERNQAQSVATLVDLTTELARRTVVAAGITWSQVVHTVIGTTGVYDAGSGHLLFAPNLPPEDQNGLVEMLRRAFGTNLTIENDANLAALGERMFGSGTSAETFVFLMVGTGVGMGIIINGNLYRGAHGTGGEVAFLPFGPNTFTEIDVTGRGMLEEAAAANGIVRTALAMGMPSPLTPKQIFDAARLGDKIALAVVEQEGKYLARAVASIAAILDPELIVLGGGIGHNLDLLIGPLERELHAITPLRPPIVASKLGEDVILLGAVATGLEVARELVFQQSADDRVSLPGAVPGDI
jgi:predicted NBD/HSP70 family sugar kinase